MIACSMAALVAVLLTDTPVEEPAEDPLRRYARKTYDSLVLETAIVRRMQADLTVGPLDHVVVRPYATEDDLGTVEGAYLGFDYAYSKSWTLFSTDDLGAYYGIRARGGMPFREGDERPFGYHRALGFFGDVGGGGVARDLPLSVEEIVNEAESLMDVYGIRSIRELKRNSRWRDYLQATKARLEAREETDSPILINIEAYGGAEFNHDFQESRGVLGAQGGYLFQTTALSTGVTDYLFDWPFASLRSIFGEPWDPSFENWAVNLGASAEYLFPFDDGARELTAGNSDHFLRGIYWLDVGVDVVDTGTFDVDAVVSVKHYDELHAPRPVVLANFDDYYYVEGTLRFNDQWSVSWKTGRLPFETEDSNSFTLGFDIARRL